MTVLQRAWPYLPFSVVLLGAAVVAAGTFWAGVRQVRSSRDVRDLALQNAALSRTIAEKNEKIADLTTRIMASVTGSDSFAYLEPLRQTQGVKYFIRHVGDVPTFDIGIRIQEIEVGTDGQRYRKLIFGPEDVARILLRGSVEWIYPDSKSWPLIFREPPEPGARPREFRVELSARNGVLVQRLRVRPVGGRWHTDSRRISGSHAGTVLPPFDEAQAQGITPENRPLLDTED